MKKLFLISIFLIIIVTFNSGCSHQANLNNKLLSLENENKEMKLKINQIDSLSMNFQDGGYSLSSSCVIMRV